MKDAGQLTVDLPADLHAELHAEAERHGWSISELVRIAWNIAAPQLRIARMPHSQAIYERAVECGLAPEPRHLCTFDVPIATPSLTNQREHWRVRSTRAKVQRKAVFVCAPTLLRMPGKLGFGFAVIDITRHAPRLLDIGDNLPAALKSVRDEVARMLGCDDRDPRVVWRYAQAKAKKPSVEISIAVRR